MGRTAKITISLPEEILEAIEDERKASGESRSEFMRIAAEKLLRQKREAEAVRQYIRGYQEIPETDEEAEESNRLASIALAGEPWE